MLIQFTPRPRDAPIFSLVLCLALVVAGCATSYQKADPKWGFFDKQLDDTHYLVGFQANGFTEHSRIVAYFLYRCGELTQQTGKSYFVVADPKTLFERPAKEPTDAEEPPPSGRIQLKMVPGRPSMVRGIISLHDGAPPPHDPYAFDPGALHAAVDRFMK